MPHYGGDQPGNIYYLSALTIGDFATKPLQGALFRKFRDQIMGVTPARDPGPGKTDSNVGKTKTSKTSLRKANQNVWYHQERKRHHRSVLGVEPGTAVRANLGSWKRISDPQDLVIFNQTRKKSSRFLISQEGRLKSHPSFTSLLHNNLFIETVFSLLQLDRKQENRDYRMESPFQHLQSICLGWWTCLCNPTS
jgi:hypothetical protein